MLRKILIIMASVFLSTVSPESQILVVIFIIVSSMFLQIRFDPCYSVTLNKMENYSLLVAAVTIYTGMFYVTGAHYSYMKEQAVSWFFLVCIVFPNMLFIAYWLINMRIEILKTIYKKNLKPPLFAVLSCSRPGAFYDKYINPDEEAEELNRQVILDTQEFSDVIVKEEGKSKLSEEGGGRGGLTEYLELNNKSYATNMSVVKDDIV